MLKKYFIAAVTAMFMSLPSMADTNKMIVNKTDGQTVTFDVSAIESGNFTGDALQVNGAKVADLTDITDIRFIDLTTLPFTITPPEGEMKAYESVPSMLRVVPASTGLPTLFAFGTVEANAAAELPMGDYGIYLSLSATAINGGGVADLSDGNQEFILKLYTYEDGQAVDSLTSVTAGNIKYAWQPARQRLTLDINATFNDGTVLKSQFTGKPVNVESIDDIVPEKKYANELVIIDAAGTSSRHIDITKASTRTRTATGSNPRTLTFVLNTDDWTYSEVTLEVVPDLIINQGDIDMATVTGNCYLLKAGPFQFYAIDAERQSPLDGVMNITRKGDNDYEIFLQVTNYYNNPFGAGQTGTRENLTIHWNGVIE